MQKLHLTQKVKLCSYVVLSYEGRIAKSIPDTVIHVLLLMGGDLRRVWGERKKFRRPDFPITFLGQNFHFISTPKISHGRF